MKSNTKRRHRRKRRVQDFAKSINRIEVYDSSPVTLIDGESLDCVINNPGVSAESFNAIAYGLMSIFQATSGIELALSASACQHATRYMAETLKITAEGGTVKIVEAPYIMSYVAGLLPYKKVPHGNGFAVYNTVVSGSIDSGYQYNGGPSNGATLYNLGVIDDSMVVDGNIPTTKAPDPYTEELGLQAYQLMIAGLKNTDNEMLKMARYPVDRNDMKTNASAFLYNIRTIGTGLFQTGGYTTVVAGETPIKSPLFSKFVTNRGENANLGRAANYTIKSVGDAVFSTVIAASVLKPHQLDTTRPPVIKQLDFNRVVDVFALACQLNLEIHVKSEEFRSLAAEIGLSAAWEQVRHPLTLQRFELTMRNVVMTYAGVFQLATQSSVPVEETGGSPTFRPFAAGAGQSASPGYRGLRMPTILSEMLATTCGIKMDTNSGAGKSPYIIAPQWGIWGGLRLNYKTYKVTIPTEGDPFVGYVFQDPGPEPVIDLVDGTVGVKLAWLNSSQYLAIDGAAHNQWMEERSANFTQLSSLNADGGIQYLSTLLRTQHVLIQSRGEIEQEEKEVTDYFPGMEEMSSAETKKMTEEYNKLRKTRYVRKRGYTREDSAFDNWSVLAVTEYNRAILPVTSGPTAEWIACTNVVRAASSAADNSSMQTFQQNTGEMVTLVKSQGAGTHLLPLDECHYNLAVTMVRDEYAPVDKTVKTLDDISADGNGGILRDLVTAVSGPGIRAVGEVATEIAARGAEHLAKQLP